MGATPVNVAEVLNEMPASRRELLHVRKEDAEILGVGLGTARHNANAVAHLDIAQTKTYDLLRDYIVDLKEEEKKEVYRRYFFAVFAVEL